MTRKSQAEKLREELVDSKGTSSDLQEQSAFLKKMEELQAEIAELKKKESSAGLADLFAELRGAGNKPRGSVITGKRHKISYGDVIAYHTNKGGSYERPGAWYKVSSDTQPTYDVPTVAVVHSKDTLEYDEGVGVVHGEKHLKYRVIRRYLRDGTVANLGSPNPEAKPQTLNPVSGLVCPVVGNA